jgi:hypothetical protein
MQMKQCSETSAHNIYTPGNRPLPPPPKKIKLSEHGKSLESRKSKYVQPFDYTCGPVKCSRNNNSLRVWTVRGSNYGGEARFSAPVHTDSVVYQSSHTMGTRSFPGIMRPGRGVEPSSHLTTRFKKSRPILLLPIRAFVPCSSVNFTFIGLHCSLIDVVRAKNFLD